MHSRLGGYQWRSLEMVDAESAAQYFEASMDRSLSPCQRRYTNSDMLLRNLPLRTIEEAMWSVFFLDNLDEDDLEIVREQHERLIRHRSLCAGRAQHALEVLAEHHKKTANLRECLSTCGAKPAKISRIFVGLPNHIEYVICVFLEQAPSSPSTHIRSLSRSKR